MRLDIDRYSRIVVLTGAGISVASGLRPYRGPNGVWEEHDVERMGHVSALADRPADTWRLFGALRAAVVNARPNAAHVALARMADRLYSSQELLLITQNVDGLHQQAGSRNVCELHGNVMYTRCTRAECTLPRFADPRTHASEVPVCEMCGSPLRPDVVLFGEELPALAAWHAKRALRDCDLFIAIGTSGTVSPASTYVRSAEYAGARTIFVNLEPMQPRNPAFKEEYLGPAEDLLPQLIG